MDMDEAEFLQAIAASPRDVELVQSYVQWLMQHGEEVRGELLLLELERRKTEQELVEIAQEMESISLQNWTALDWIDDVLPLEIVSPMVGTFYSAASPEARPYVSPGDRCSPFTIVCIIEAMKVFQEIPAATTGVVTEVLVRNGETVDYGRPLFRLKRARGSA